MTNNVLLETKNVVKKFGGLTAVNNVSIQVNTGEVVGLIGANGAGKTTLFNMISGALPVTSGEIIFNGKHIQNKPSFVTCRMGIGRTHQIVKPFQTISVLDNITVGALKNHANVAVAKDKAAEICQLVGLGGRMNVPGSALNLSELKRMELARALATEPKLILLDEVMAGLNPKDSQEVIDLVRKINEMGITLLLIEHVMKAVMSLSHRIYVMNQGCLIAQGEPEEITSNPEVIKSYLGERYKNAQNR